MLNEYYIAAILGAVLTALSHLFLKKGVMVRSLSGPVWRSMMNVYSMTGYFLLVLVTFLNLFALKVVQLKDMAYLLAIPFLLVPTLSMVLFKERMNRRQVLGALIILAGVVVFNLDRAG